MAEDLIRMEHINKFYGRVQALKTSTLQVSSARRSSGSSATTARASRR